MNMRNRINWSFLAGVVLVLTFFACATMKSTPPAPTLVVTPDKTVLSPALIKKPIAFSGSGWKPKEMVVVELIVPPGVKVKGVTEGDDVGLAFANADANGNFEAKIAPLGTLNFLFQVAWVMTETGAKPDFKQATPLPPRVYTIRASGFDSELEAKATLTILAPPKKK